MAHFPIGEKIQKGRAHIIYAYNRENQVARECDVSDIHLVGITQDGLSVEGFWEGNLVRSHITARTAYIWHLQSAEHRPAAKKLLRLIGERDMLQAGYVNWYIIREKP